ncbi:unnamed protein product [Trifolium pratense]|uniref:Uncharacterized protein n=1 Tax=Trifolium pratense TaxID=57577 RepID=A0ACB0IXN0_TRIPR|nr:unnamed protein product [Trifolium pratense]
MGDDVHQWKTVQGRRRKGSQKKSDFATTISSLNEHPDDITTYFFTSFPDSFGALAMLRAFKYYGNVTEVVIPTKRDVGGRRFGFTRFARVMDIRGFELELDNIIGQEGRGDSIVTSDLDVERTVWLRIYGVPSHAWNVVFFAQLVKPWGSFINEEEGTLKKSTMDVARLMIRTSCQEIIDEFIDVKFNGDVYHLRVLEDSYGPMRIMIPQKNGNEGRDSSVESEEDGEEEVRGMWTEGDMEDRESEMGELLALKSASNANIVQVNISGPNLGSNNDKAEGKESSKCVDGVRSKEDNRLVDGGILLGHEDGAGGTQHTSNTNLSITGGVVRNETQSAEVSCLQLSLVSEGGGEGHGTRGVYNDGLRNVYIKLTKAGAIGNQDAQGKGMTRIHPTPAKVRKHQHTIQNLNLKIPNPDLSLSSFRANPIEDEVSSCRSVFEFNGVTRNPPSQHRSSRKPTSSLSSVGEILCCSSLSSSNFHNCNRRFMEKYDQESAQKLWQGATELGVVGEEVEDTYVEKILNNEKRDEAARRLREQHNTKNRLLYIVNIYSPCSLAGKRKLWKDLLEFKSNNAIGDWVLEGDFNAISKSGERRGNSGSRSLSERSEFSLFMEATEVIDIPVLGKKFTWFNSDGSAMSRLDRFLLSEGFIHQGEFFDLVKKIWAQSDVRGTKTFVISEKMKRLKEALKKWNRDVFGFKDLCIDKTVRELNEVEDLIANGGVDPTDLNSKELVRNFWEQIHSAESLLRQKSRTKWIQEGDSNSRFFHSSIKGRRRRNQIVMLKQGEAWLEEVAAIKKEVKNHFVKHLSEDWNSRPFLQGVDFNSLSVDDNAFLLALFDDAEVKETVWSYDGNKNPDPDGFNLHFFKAFCDLFPDLYAKEAIKNVKVSERLRGNGLVPLWRWNWSESLSVNEARQLTELQGLFDGFSLHNNNHDQWRWIPDSNGLFTVKSCYTYLLNLRQVQLQDALVLEAIQRLWKSDVPSKVNVFGWMLLLNRLPTRAALHHRGILTNHHELSCVFCFQQAEDGNHLFFSCPFSKGI